jgi:hypothetical protein
MDDVPRNRCCERGDSPVRNCRRITCPASPKLSTTQRWLEARTECDGGHFLSSIPCHAHPFGSLYAEWIGQLHMAGRIPGAIPSARVARPSGEGRYPSGPVHHRWRWSRGYGLLAKRSALLQGRQRVCHPELHPGGQARSDPTRAFLFALIIGSPAERSDCPLASARGATVRHHGDRGDGGLTASPEE